MSGAEVVKVGLWGGAWVEGIGGLVHISVNVRHSSCGIQIHVFMPRNGAIWSFIVVTL